MLREWPTTVSLRTLCIRSIYSNQVDLTYMPPLALTLPYEDEEAAIYAEIEESYRQVERGRKRKREEEEEEEATRSTRQR